MALSTLVLAALLVAASPVYGQIGTPTSVMGGATSIVELAKILTSQCPDSGTYQAVGSGTGISEFNKGAYVVGFSDQPMTLKEENVANTVAFVYKKCTIPIVLSVFNFFVKTPSGTDGIIKLDAQQTYNIFKSGGDWSAYKAAFTVANAVTGPIVRVARSDNSGTTFTIKLFWKAALGKKVSIVEDSTPLPFGGLNLQSGTTAVCTTANAQAGAITYAQVGVCDSFGKLTEVAIKNKGKKYVVASKSNSIGSLPRVIPKNCGASWASFGKAMMFRTGAATPPIVALAYGFIRAKGLGQAGALGPKGKSALTCWLNKVNSVSGLQANLKFFPLPAKLLTKAKAAVLTVKN